MSAIIVLHGGERVKVTEEFRNVVELLSDHSTPFRHFATEGTFPKDPLIAVCVDAVVAVLQA